MKFSGFLINTFFFLLPLNMLFSQLGLDVASVEDETITNSKDSALETIVTKDSSFVLLLSNLVVDESLTRFTRKKLEKKGDKCLKINALEKARLYYEAAFSKVNNPKQVVRLGKKNGDVNFALRNYNYAEAYYSKAIQLNFKHKKYPLLEYQLANTYKYLAKYDLAIELYTKFARLQTNNDKLVFEKRRARLALKGAAFAIENSTIDSTLSIKKLSDNINSSTSENGPEYFEAKLFFNKTYKNDLVKIYFSEYYSNSFGVFQDFDNNITQSKVHVSDPSFSPTGNTLYFTECTVNDVFEQQCRIMKSEKLDEKWQKPTALNKNINAANSNATQAQISTTPEGNEVLFFVSDRKGSRGGKDLWMSIKNEEGIFQRAQRLSSPINTSYDEISPYYHKLSNTLYFSSNGHLSFGGFDVYKLINFFNNDDDDLEVINMNYPINSSVDDYDFILSESTERAFLSSNRKDSFDLKSKTCCDNIFQLEKNEINLVLKTLVYIETESGRILYNEADLYLYLAESDKKVDQLLKKGSNSYFINLLEENEYKILAISDSFENASIYFNTLGLNKSDTLQYDLFLKSVAPKDVFFARIQYQFNSSNLRTDAPEILQSVIEFMSSNPNTIVEVGSFTDSKGSAEYNLALGQQRSGAVVNYISKMGKIAIERLKNVSYGEAFPIAPNQNDDGTDNKAGRDLNRRTEFKVIGVLPTED